MNKNTISKWFSMFLLMMVAGITGATAQSLTVADFNLDPGQSTEVNITLAAPADQTIYGIQTDITLSEGLTLEEVAAVNAELQFDQNTLTGGATRVALLSLANASLPAGDVIKMRVKAADNFESGTITLANSKLTTSTAGAEITIDGSTANVTKTPVVEEDEFDFFYWPSGASQANSITLAEGVTIAITGNTSKNIQNGNDITIDGTKYKTMKVSNGAQNTLTLAKKAKSITFYSYINKASTATGLRDTYWKEIAGENYDAETSGGLMTCFSDGNFSNPDVRTYTFNEPLDVITFTNAGEQVCYVIKVVYAKEETPTPVETTATFNFADPNFREKIGTSAADVDGWIYNETFTADGASLQVTAGSSPSRIYVDSNRGQNLVTYKEYTTLTFKAPEGKAITKIEFTAAGNSNINNFTASSGAIEGMVWTGNADGVRFAQGGTSYLANAILTMVDKTGETAALPAIEYTECENIAAFNALAAGTYAKLTLTDAEVIGKSADGYSTVWIQDATGGCWIQYTSLNSQLNEKTKINGTIYAIKRDAAGNTHIKEAEATLNSELNATAIDAYTAITGTIAEVNVAANLNKVVKIAADSLEMTSATAGKLYLGETTINVSNGTDAANQALCKIAGWEKNKKLENITIVAILTASSTANQLLPISIEETVEEPVNTEIVNANFEADEPIATKVCTYAKDVTEGQVAQMQPITGWTIVENGDARAAGTFAYGSTAILGGDGGNVPAVGPNGETEGKVLGLEAVWSATAQYTQDVKLPAGEYLFEAVIYNAAGTGALESNLIGVDGNYLTTKSYPVGKWTKDLVKFTLAEEKTVTVSIGVNSGNVGNGVAPHLFIDHVKLYGSEEIAAIELAAAKENALAAIEALPAGEGLFYYSQTDIDNAKTAVNAAETVEAVAAVAMPTPNAPAADKAYAIANATATGNLCITEGKVSVAKDAAVYFTAVEGGYVLSNEAGDYIFKTDNDWTLSTTKEIASAYVVTIVPVESGYTIKGAKGLFGLDSTDEGSTVYANKSQDKNGLWTIAEYVAPVAPTTDYTSYIVNADLTGEGGFDATGTKGIDGSGIVKAGNNAQFDFSQTIANLPAGKYKVTAQAAYRYSGSEADEAAAIAEAKQTKFAKLYATVGENTVDTLVQNRYDGASETDYANGDGSVLVNEKYVPNSSDAVKAWFAAGQYVNEVVFNIAEEGPVTIGIEKTAQPEAGDYTVIGPWTLTRLGDAEVEPEPEPEPFFADGKYYIYNNGTKNYLAAGADWGTHAVVNATGLDYTLTQADGKYTMDSQISNGGNNHFLNGEWNDGSAMGWTFAAVEGKEGVYTISNGEKFLTAAENNLVTLADDATAEAAQWTLKTLEARIAELATATAETPVNATFLIQDANFGRNDLRKSAWTIEASNQKLSDGNNTNNNAESFHSVFTLSQVLTNVPKGVYTLTAQGFYRQDGSDNENLPVFFANDYTQTFPLKTGTENSMAEASTSFSAGNYTIDPIYFQLTEAGDLTVGAKLENNAELWCIWDNFQLTYYGADADLEAVKNAAIIKELADLRAKAEALKAEVEVDAVKTAIDEALGATAEASGADAINTAIATMKAVIEKADVHIAAKAALDGMANVMAGTNVYTAEAFETYNGIYETAKGKYEAGELTKDDVIENPEAQMGWHAANTVDDLLLSVWTIGETQCKDYDAGMYINTWSVEGNNDGSNFKVPFFEYWTGDANSLGENVLTATMTNLPEGEYDVTAWVRVRMKNGAEAPTYGITFQANDGEAVNVAAGDQVGTSQMYLKEFTATGTVAADGVLKIKFNVAADNNISWLSFKNVKFEKKTAVEPQDSVLALTLNVERYPGLGYGVTEAAVDFTEAKQFLGVETITTDMLRIVNPNDSLISDYAPYDGWFNGEGAAEKWGDNTKINVKFFQAIPEGTYTVCDMNGADAIGATYSVKWALEANAKKVVYTINVKFVEKPVITLTFTDLNKKDEQTVALTSELGKSYEGLTADVDVAAILAKLEVSSLNDVTVYAVQSDGSLDDNYKLGTTDGWRNAAGDWQGWGDDAYFCVKTDFAAESSQIYYVGGMEGKNTLADAANPAAYTATYAFVKTGTTDAVVLKVTLTYTISTGINAIARDARKNAIFNMNGQKVQKAQRGLYIINGKKVVIK